MGRTHWCHEHQTKGLSCCTNYRNGVCMVDSFENFINPCKYRHPYPPDDKTLEELCQIFASYTKVKPNPEYTSPASVKSRKPPKSTYNPVEKAYDILYKVFSNENAGWDEASIAIEEAVGFLGEALAE